MKITEKQLRQLIKKEILNETFSPMQSIASKKLDEVDPAGVQRATGLYASAAQMNKIKSLMGVLFEETAREAMEDGADEQLAEELALAALLEAAADGLESLGFLAEANAIRQMQEM